MSIIEQLRDRVTRYNEGLTSGQYISEIIEENEAYIVELNADIQLYEEGINSLGVSIADYMPYTPLTIRIKEAKGQPTDRVTLRDEGDFEKSFYLVVGSEQFEIMAEDWKTEQLIQKYGRSILGLTDENIAKIVNNIIYPQLLRKAKDIIL